MPRTRRNPRYAAFLGTGAVVGLVAAVVLALGPGSGVDDPRRLLAYLCALLAGALLAFALSFDEIIVTTFTAGPRVQTLPLWIFSNLARPNQAPVVAVVAAVLVVLSFVPVWLAQRLSADPAGGRL